MADCTLDVTPLTASPGGQTLYYDSDCLCYTSFTSATPVHAVEVETTLSTFTLTLNARTTSAVAPPVLTAYCGPDNPGATAFGITTTGTTYTVTFDSPGSTDATWGWDFVEEGSPPPLKMKVRIKRL